MNANYECKICNRTFEKLSGFAVHIKRTHQISDKDYFDTYIKTDNNCKCLYCGKETYYTKWSYANYCNRSCQFLYNKDKMLFTMNERYNCDYAIQNNQLRQKIISTNQDRYGVNWRCESKEVLNKAILANIQADSIQKRVESTKKTCLDKYGTNCILTIKENLDKSHSKEANEKRRNTYLSKDITEIQNKIKQTCIDRYNVDNGFKIDKAIKNKNSSEARRKANYTMRQKRKYDSPTDYFENELNKRNIEYICEYSSKEYPYNCDFYIPKDNLYIEINIHPTHNGRFFNKTSIYDLNEVEYFKSKHSEYYNKIIEVWTIRDLEKYDCAKKNNLNYICFWNIQDMQIWLDDLH